MKIINIEFTLYGCDVNLINDQNNITFNHMNDISIICLTSIYVNKRKYGTYNLLQQQSLQGCFVFAFMKMLWQKQHIKKYFRHVNAYNTYNLRGQGCNMEM